MTGATPRWQILKIGTTGWNTKKLHMMIANDNINHILKGFGEGWSILKFI